jgi:hypothetical protein
MAMMKDDTSKGPAAPKPDKVRQHVRALLVKLTEHVKQKSVDGPGSIKAKREEQNSGCVEYV